MPTIRQVSIRGAYSAGKTDLAKSLANYYGTVFDSTV